MNRLIFLIILSTFFGCNQKCPKNSNYEIGYNKALFDCKKLHVAEYKNHITKSEYYLKREFESTSTKMVKLYYDSCMKELEYSRIVIKLPYPKEK